MSYKKAQFRFYEELNDFLPAERRKQLFFYRFKGSPSIKDAVEALGVPHTEVDLILVNGNPVGFDYSLQHGDRAAVYPMFECIDISPLIKLRQTPLRNPRFIADVHLGKLARYLRLLGFDTLYRNDLQDAAIVYLALQERRTILTRNRGILKTRAVTHGYWIRATAPEEQIIEVIYRFDLRDQIRPFHRCLVCNGIIEKIEKQLIRHRLKPKTEKYYHDFYICTSCDKLYWKGSHYDRMRSFVDKILGRSTRESHA